MVVALTARTLKPGTFDQFRPEFLRDFDPQDPPAGWVRFSMLRNAESPDEVITFGFFDGTVEELRAASADQDYADQQKRIEPFVDFVNADGVFHVVEDYTT